LWCAKELEDVMVAKPMSYSSVYATRSTLSLVLSRLFVAEESASTLAGTGELYICCGYGLVDAIGWL
jgi:hypothetical protein